MPTGRLHTPLRAHVLLLLPLLAVTTGASCAPSRPGAAVSSKGTDAGSLPPPDLELTGVRFRAYRGNETKATGDAASATWRQGSSDGVAVKANAFIPNATGGRELRLSGGLLTGNAKTRLGEVTEGLSLQMADGSTAVTDRGSFDGNAQTAKGVDPVTSEGRQFHAIAHGGFEFQFTPPTTLNFVGPVETTIMGEKP